MNKIVVCLFFVCFVIAGFGQFFNVSAQDTVPFGWASYTTVLNAGGGTNAANVLVTDLIYTNTISSGDYDVVVGHIYFKNIGNVDTWCKMVILDHDGTVVSISDPVHIVNPSSFINFTFSGAQIDTTDRNSYYFLGYILSNTAVNLAYCYALGSPQWMYDQIVGQTYSSLVSPATLTNTTSMYGAVTAYLDLDLQELASTPTPISGSNSGSFVVYFVILVLFAVVAVVAGLWLTAGDDSMNKGVALLFAFVAFVVFMVLFFGSGWFG